MLVAHTDPRLRPARSVWPQIFVGGMVFFLPVAIAASANGVLPTERTFSAWLIHHDSPQLNALFTWVNELGDKELLVPLAALLVLAMPVKLQSRLWLLLGVLVVSWGFQELTQVLVGRPSPLGEGDGFPSGRATAASAFYVFGAYLIQQRLERRATKIAVWLLGIAFVLVVCLSQLIVHAHWPLDAMGGAMLGLTCAAAGAWWSDVHRHTRAITHEGSAAPVLVHLLYRAYELRLLRQVKPGPMPRHVGVILDGHRRHGAQTGVTDARMIYHLGAQRLDDVLDWCEELDIPTLTLWVFSTDNFARPPEVVSSILGTVESKLSALSKAPQTHRRRIRVRAIGRLGLLPQETISAIRAAEESTKCYDGLELNIAIAYGGREEIADAVRGLLREKIEQGIPPAKLVDSITLDAIARHLYTAGSPDPDLIIRTSGEIRLSGFLLWQSAHSEFYFSDVYWPAFRKIDFLRAIRSFQQRERRFGR